MAVSYLVLFAFPILAILAWMSLQFPFLRPAILLVIALLLLSTGFQKREFERAAPLHPAPAVPLQPPGNP